MGSYLRAGGFSLIFGVVIFACRPKRNVDKWLGKFTNMVVEGGERKMVQRWRIIIPKLPNVIISFPFKGGLKSKFIFICQLFCQLRAVGGTWKKRKKRRTNEVYNRGQKYLPEKIAKEILLRLPIQDDRDGYYCGKKSATLRNEVIIMICCRIIIEKNYSMRLSVHRPRDHLTNYQMSIFFQFIASISLFVTIYQFHS